MRNLAILTFLTLDGVMQAPGSSDEDTSGNFKFGGWALNYWEEVMSQVAEEAMATPYDLLLGRKTYEIFAGHFPNSQDDPIAYKLNKSTKYVVTSSLTTLSWENSQSITGHVSEEVSKLKKQDGPLLQVHGSWELIQSLISSDLVDELRLWIFPLVLGNGKRLFDSKFNLSKYELTKIKNTSNGVIMAIYKRIERIN